MASLLTIWRRQADGTQHTIVDNAVLAVSGIVTVTQGLAGSSAWLADIVDRAGRLLGIADVSDRAGRLLGIVTAAALDVALSTRASETTLATVLAATMAIEPRDVTDRSARILGHVAVDTSALPTGAATEGTLLTRLTEAMFVSRINTQGQKAMADSTPVVVANDQSSISTTDVVSANLPNLVDCDYFAGGISAASTFFLAIDVSNGSGAYKHVAGTAFKIATVSGILIKSSASAKWTALFGVILAINGVNATIAYLRFGSVLVQDTNVFQTPYDYSAFPALVDCAVTGGDFTKIAAGFRETTVSVNTGVTLPDVRGNAVTPGVGDAVIKVTKDAGAGSSIIHYSLLYQVV
jgi:hypothetical protein